MTDDNAIQNAIDALARQVVAEQAPAELPLFTATAARYRDDPAGTLAASGGHEKALGFGVETAVVLLAPFALDLAKRTFTKLAEKLGDSAADSIAGKISALLRHDGHDGHDAPESKPEPLTPEQLALVSQTAREQAAHLNLPADQSEALANAVIATLATRS